MTSSSCKYESSAKQRWTIDEAQKLYSLPLNDLLLRAQLTHRENFSPNEIQCCQLLSIKTGGCPEDCGYCSQSVTAETRLPAEPLMDIEEILKGAHSARSQGATRYCMGAAWRSLKQRDIERICSIISAVKALGLETCMTLGMLDKQQAKTLADAGLDYYNHNLDTSEAYYHNVVTTRAYAERLATIEAVQLAGIKVCSGGIFGLGEAVEDRIAMLVTLANMPEPPASVPLNLLVPISGTRLADAPTADHISFVRIVALTRLLMPRSMIRLAAGRRDMGDALQALCFFAGANSVFIGDRLLTTPNPEQDQDEHLFQRLGLMAMSAPA